MKNDKKDWIFKNLLFYFQYVGENLSAIYPFPTSPRTGSGLGSLGYLLPTFELSWCELPLTQNLLIKTDPLFTLQLEYIDSSSLRELQINWIRHCYCSFSWFTHPMEPWFRKTCPRFLIPVKVRIFWSSGKKRAQLLLWEWGRRRRRLLTSGDSPKGLYLWLWAQPASMPLSEQWIGKKSSKNCWLKATLTFSFKWAAALTFLQRWLP